MKYRFAIELEFPLNELSQEQTGEILALALREGFVALGHSRNQSVTYSLERLRARSIDPSKPVGEQE